MRSILTWKNLPNIVNNTHDDGEYIKLAIGTDDKADSQKEAQNDASVATSLEQLESISDGTIEKVNNSTGDECITCIKNPYTYHITKQSLLIIMQPVYLMLV